jgi:hypothetical protein
MKIVDIDDQKLNNRQIYKDDYSGNIERSMTSEVTKWWKGLGRELEDDIESLEE